MDKIFMFRSPLESLVYVALSLALFVGGVIVGRCRVRRVQWWHFTLFSMIGVCLSIVQGWWFLRGF